MEYAEKKGVSFDEVAWKPSIHMPKKTPAAPFPPTPLVQRKASETIKGYNKDKEKAGEYISCGVNYYQYLIKRHRVF